MKKIRMFTVLLCFCLIFSMTGCRTNYDFTYYPWYDDDYEDYVWYCEKAEMFWEAHPALGMIGCIKINSEQVYLDIGGDAVHYFAAQEFKKGMYECNDDGMLTHGGDLGEWLFFALSPRFYEDSFVCQVKLNIHYLFAGKKLTFVKYSKSEIQPSDLGFDLDSWDDLLQHYDIVDETGEVISEEKRAEVLEPKVYHRDTEGNLYQVPAD